MASRESRPVIFMGKPRPFRGRPYGVGADQQLDAVTVGVCAICAHCQIQEIRCAVSLGERQASGHAARQRDTTHR
jgi:hypothetical protein